MRFSDVGQETDQKALNVAPLGSEVDPVDQELPFQHSTSVTLTPEFM